MDVALYPFSLGQVQGREGRIINRRGGVGGDNAWLLLNIIGNGDLFYLLRIVSILGMHMHIYIINNLFLFDHWELLIASFVTVCQQQS